MDTPVDSLGKCTTTSINPSVENISTRLLILRWKQSFIFLCQSFSCPVFFHRFFHRFYRFFYRSPSRDVLTRRPHTRGGGAPGWRQSRYWL